MRQVWWQNWEEIRLMISELIHCVRWIIFSALEIFYHLGTGRFSDARKHGAGSTTIWFQAHCRHPFVVHNICLHDPGSHWNTAGGTSAGRTTRFPKTSAHGWTLAEYNIIFGQILGQGNSSVDCESSFVESFWQGELEYMVACVTSSWRFWLSDLNFAIDLFQPARRSARWTQQQKSFSHPRRNATRMCVEPAFVLRCIAMGMSAWRQNAETRKCGALTFAITWHFYWTLRFADDISPFARTAAQAMALVDLVHKLQNFGLQLNTGKIGKNSYLNFRRSPAIFLAYPQWK